MPDTDATADTTTAEAPAPAPTPIKPAWKTSEAYFSLAAMLLGWLYASGVISAGTSADRIAGLAVVLLAATGHQVSRTILKKAGVLVLIVALADTQTACTWLGQQGKATEKGAIDCTVGTAREAVTQFGPVLDALLAQAAAPDGKVNWDPVKDLTKGFGAELGGCVLASVVAHELAPAPDNPNAPKSSPLELDAASLRSGFEGVRAAQLGGATFKTEHGTL